MATEHKKSPEWAGKSVAGIAPGDVVGLGLGCAHFGGVLLGYFLDQWLGTKPTFTVGLIFFGIFVSYYNLGKFINRMKKLDEQFLKEKKEIETIEKK